MNSFNITARRVQARRSIGMDARAFMITILLSVAVFAGFYAIGRKVTTPAVSREQAPLRLPVSAAATAVLAAVSAAAPLELQAPRVLPTPSAHAQQPRSANVTRSLTPVETSPAVVPRAPVLAAPTHAPPAPASSAPPANATGGAPAGSGGGSSHAGGKGGGTSFDSSG